jgi:O-antigen ligase
MIPIALMQSWKAYQKSKIFISFLFIFTTLFFIVCTLVTQSRMGIIATAIGILYLITRPVWPISRTLILIIFLSLGGIFVITSGERLLDRYSSIQDKSNSDRVLTWQNGWEVFKDNPFFGVGIHQAKNSFYKNTQYPFFQSEFKQLEVHNTFLKVASELGIIGLSIFLLIFDVFCE